MATGRGGLENSVMAWPAGEHGSVPERRTRRRKVGVVCGVALCALVILGAGGCAAGPGLTGSAVGPTPAGFWLGFWHGLIAPVTFLVSLFNDSVSIYEIHNNGNWYDAGFMIGISSIFSAMARSGATHQQRRTMSAGSVPQR